MMTSAFFDPHWILTHGGVLNRPLAPNTYTHGGVLKQTPRPKHLHTHDHPGSKVSFPRTAVCTPWWSGLRREVTRTTSSQSM